MSQNGAFNFGHGPVLPCRPRQWIRKIMRYVQLASTAFVLVHRSISPPHRRSIIRQYASTSSSNLDNNYQDLVAWLQREGSFIHESIQLKPSTRGGGYGAFVTNSVEEGTLLFSIPRKVCVTMEKVTADETCGGSFQKVIERAGPGEIRLCWPDILPRNGSKRSTT